MIQDNSEIKILIFITCDHHLFKDRYSECIRHWLLSIAHNSETKPTLKFTESHIINEGLPSISEIKKYNGMCLIFYYILLGVIITGSFSRIATNQEWMKSLRHTIRLCYIHQVPIFAICFGFQILSQAFGSSFMESPLGFNFGAYNYKIDLKALPFFKPYLEEYLSDANSRSMFGFNTNDEELPTLNGYNHNGYNHNQILNNHNGYNNHKHYIHEDEKMLKPMIGLFSHNDIVTSLPNVDNIDFGDIPDKDRKELYESFSDMLPIKISSTERAPIVGMLLGNKSKVFMISMQLHPEFDTYLGFKFLNEILYLKLEQGIISREKYENNMKDVNKSNSGYVFGKMALNLFMNGYIKPEY